MQDMVGDKISRYASECYMDVGNNRLANTLSRILMDLCDVGQFLFSYQFKYHVYSHILYYHPQIYYVLKS